MRLNGYTALAVSALAMAFAVEVATAFTFPLQLAPGVAEASENQVLSPPAPNDGGIGIRVFGPVTFQLANLTMQCPGVDVYVRAGCATCLVDAGPGDLKVSFNASPDSYPFPLDTVSSGQDRIIFQNVDGGVAACNFYVVKP